jgi:hypothetical protein
MKNVFINVKRPCVFISSLQAQYASFGSGIGLNMLRSNDLNLSSGINTKTTNDQYAIIGKPRLSLNIDYNFPREISSKWFKKIYNPIFSNAHLQFRGQIIFNQFNVSEEKNSSIATLGGSFLYFPKVIDENKKTNFFIEAGYKWGWNNTIVDPFNGIVTGIGTRHRLGNDWYWQANLTYTFAFYDYLDLSGSKGYAKTSQDGYFLLNFSLLKPFLTNKEQKRVDQSRDSLAVAENFAASVLLKSTKTIDVLKTFQNQVKAVEDKVLASEKTALKLSETANLIIKKVNVGYTHLKTKDERHNTEREMDSLQSISFSINLAYSVEFEKMNFDILSKNPMEQKLVDAEQEVNEARQNLLFANKFLPRSKDFKFKIQQLEARELGMAKESVDKMVKEKAIIQAKMDKNKARVKALVVIFEKTDKELKTAAQELERINAVIDKMKNQ